MGRSVKKDVYTFSAGTWNLTSTKLFVYDSWHLIQELNGSGTVEKSYVWGLDLSQSIRGAGGVGGLIASTDGTDTFLYGYGANGNVGQMIAIDGSVQAHYEYDPFGNEVFSYGSLKDDNPFRFSTKRFDTETGLYYYGMRYYSSELGRWLTRDPIEEKGGLNLYIFSGNNSINLFDILGLKYVFINVYYNFKNLPESSKEIVEDAFEDCFNKKCSACIHVWFEWIETKKSYKDLDLGFIGNKPSGINIYVDDSHKGSQVGYTTGNIFKMGNESFINPKQIKEDIKHTIFEYHEALGNVIAHEIGLHSVGKKYGHYHWFKTRHRYIDEYSPPAWGPRYFSPSACTKLCKKFKLKCDKKK